MAPSERRAVLCNAVITLIASFPPGPAPIYKTNSNGRDTVPYRISPPIKPHPRHLHQPGPSNHPAPLPNRRGHQTQTTSPSRLFSRAPHKRPVRRRLD
jgi:hypothetical protein